MTKRKSITPGPLTEVPRPPSHLGKEARSIYTQVAEYLLDRELLHSGDLLTLEVYSMGVAKLRQLEREMLDCPVLTEDGKVHAGVHALNTLSGVVQKGAAQLGLAPMSRTRLTVSAQRAGKKAESEDQWMRVLKGGKE